MRTISKRHLSFRNSSHTLLADKLRVYHSPTKNKYQLYSRWIQVDSRFWKMYTFSKKFFGAITSPLSVFRISFYRKLKVGDLVNPRQRISKFVPLPNLASHLLICNLDKITNTYITITWMVQLGFNIRTSLILEICILVFV